MNSLKNNFKDFFEWRKTTNTELDFAYKVFLSFLFAGLVGLSAQFYFPLPFTPVPVTGQVLMVLITGVVLGARYGAFSMGIYSGLGAFGVPWFAPKMGAPIFSSGGWGVLSGVTGGYILGFILAALTVGYVTENFIKGRKWYYILPTMFLGVGIIYTLGVSWLFYALSGLGKEVTIIDSIKLGALPFISGDILKALLASTLATYILPVSAIAGEKDLSAMSHWSKRLKIIFLAVSALLMASLASIAYLYMSNLETMDTEAVLTMGWYSAGILFSGIAFVYLLKRP